jgi:predicted RNase H-like HicB family nuclease
MEMERTMDAHEILKRPYARLVTPDVDGSFFAEIVEFPGCFTTGKTAADALQNLEGVAVDWINTVIAQGQDIPEPMESNEYSGKTVLRMTRGLHRRAALWAEREGVSLNHFITTCLAEAVGERARQATIYPVARVQSVVTTTIDPAMLMNGTAAFIGFSGNRITRPTGTNVGLVRVMVGDRDQERQNA